MTAPKLICILGAESTGKTTLARDLAAHFGSVWVPEYLREFCDVQQRTPTRDEQALILEQQLNAESTALALRSGPYVFCDTAPLLTAVYSDYVFNDQSLYPRARALHARYAITLFLQPDLPWIADGLQREGAHVRGPITELIERELTAAALPFQPIVGNRKQAAIDILSQLPH
jgi:nicotinamide riboside kinase